MNGYELLEQIKAEVAAKQRPSLLNEGWTTVTAFTERAMKNPTRRPPADRRHWKKARKK